VEDGHALIQRMLSQYSASATATFGVYERVTKNGSEWHVFPTRVRNASGVSENVPALLDHTIYIPVGKRTFSDMFREILRQVSDSSGYKVILGYSPVNYFGALQDHEDNYGAENRSARDALADLLGPSFVWYLYNVPGEKKFFMDIHIEAAPTSALAPQRFRLSTNLAIP
jgi:hypothetical protein